MKQKGFTLVEVVVSLMLLMMLAGVANLSVDVAENQRRQARQANSQAEEARTQLYAGKVTEESPLGEVTYNFSYFTVTATARPVETDSGSRYVVFATPAPSPTPSASPEGGGSP